MKTLNVLSFGSQKGSFEPFIKIKFGGQNEI